MTIAQVELVPLPVLHHAAAREANVCHLEGAHLAGSDATPKIPPAIARDTVRAAYAADRLVAGLEIGNRGTGSSHLDSPVTSLRRCCTGRSGYKTWTIYSTLVVYIAEVNRGTRMTAARYFGPG